MTHLLKCFGVGRGRETLGECVSQKKHMYYEKIYIETTGEDEWGLATKTQPKSL